MNLHSQQASHKTPSANGAVITVTRSSVSAAIHVANYSPLLQSIFYANNTAYISIEKHHLQSRNAFCNFAKQTIKQHTAMAKKSLRNMTDKEVKTMQKELVDTMLKKAGIKKADIIDSAIRRWVNANLDLLTPEEQKKYACIL